MTRNHKAGGASQDVFQFVRLTETSVAEINVLDHPLFRLGKTAKPTRGIDPRDGALLTAPQDYRTEFRFNGNQRLVLEADPLHGYPNIVAMRVLFAIIDEARLRDYASRKIPITLSQIAAWMGMRRPGGTQLESILDAMRSLAGLKVRFFNSWYDTATNTRESTDCAALAEQLEEAKNEADRLAALALTAPPEARDERLEKAQTAKAHYNRLATAMRVASKDNKPAEGWDRLITEWALGDGTGNFVELGQRLFDSLTRRYRVGIDRAYFLSLRRPLAQRLYTYFAKEDGRRRDGVLQPVYRETLGSLVPRLPLFDKYPSRVIEHLQPALELLKTPIKGKCYLSSYSFGPDLGWNTVLEVTFAAASLRAGVHASVRGRAAPQANGI